MSKTFETMHGPMHVSGNGHARDVLYWKDLTDVEREEWDYLRLTDSDWRSFTRFRGEVYSLEDFEIAEGIFKGLGYHGVLTLSAFSAILVRYITVDSVVVASCHW